MSRHVVTALVVAGLVAAGVTASGAQPARAAAALVLELSGTPAPPVQPFTEIPAGTTLRLPAGGRLTFLHYHTCRAVTLVGGRVTVDAETYTVSGNASVKETRTPCPRPVTLRAGGEVAVGGFVTRSLGPALTFSARPGFVLAGPRATDFRAARFARNDVEVLSVPLDGPRLRWPPGAAPLAAGVYDVTLLPASAEQEPRSFRFRVTESAADPAAEPLTVIHVE
jgi:hypothetical protein